MSTTALLKKVRKIEIKTRGLSNHIFAGEYNTAFKGRGMAFSEVREYQSGDDVRSIDWNVTARYNSPYIKVFEEEREMTVMLLVDVSGSGNFGTKKQFKREIATELSAILAFSAIKNNDKVGVIFFSDIIEEFIPPKKGKSHILRIIRQILSFKPKNKKTDISQERSRNQRSRDNWCCKNIEYLDQIYYTIAEMDILREDTILAKENYLNSTLYSVSNDPQYNNEEGVKDTTIIYNE